MSGGCMVTPKPMGPMVIGFGVIVVLGLYVPIPKLNPPTPS